MRRALLEVNSLSIRYRGAARDCVKNLSFTLYKSEILCLRGRSGSGKSTVMLAIMGMLPEYNADATGFIMYGGDNILAMSEGELRCLRWRHIALAPQSAMNSFNPMYTIRRSLREMLLLGQKKMSGKELRRQEEALMDMVCLDKRVLSCYAHELSGGMKQRAAIALALVYQPKILILDEATTGLDIKSQADVLGTLLRIKEQWDMSILFISHDAALGDILADRRVELP
jgi:peptide/nickel transport system ATP-binding protein